MLYVEGARDREILACWARRLDHSLSRAIERHSVILGGRRPQRALSDFQRRRDSYNRLEIDGPLDVRERSSAPTRVDAGGRRDAPEGLQGLVLLDRDGHLEEGGERALEVETGLDVFVWSQRHIESYLLVPAAIRRAVGLPAADRRIERFVEDERSGPEGLHAKRILGASGSLARVVGSELNASEIARSMHREEFHPDIFDLFDRISGSVGLSWRGPEVVVRTRPNS